MGEDPCIGKPVEYAARDRRVHKSQVMDEPAYRQLRLDEAQGRRLRIQILRMQNLHTVIAN
ncbi:MAG: hypothetical protein C4338_06535, partial [Rhodanobacteraceae bacterium]